jgi:hypothetical protein
MLTMAKNILPWFEGIYNYVTVIPRPFERGSYYPYDDDYGVGRTDYEDHNEEVLHCDLLRELDFTVLMTR